MNDLLEITDKLGINPLAIIGVVVVSAVLKQLDPKDKFKAGYVLFPLIAGLAVCRLLPGLTWQEWILQSLASAAFAGYGYDLYARLIKGRVARRK